MTKNKVLLMTMSTLTAITLAACGDTEVDSVNPADPDNQVDMTEEMEEAMDEDTDTEMGHGEMDHSSDGEVPEGLAEAENPEFEVGSQVIVNADHMLGMDGAEGTVVGAYDTTVYSLSFTPTTGGDPVEDHKWVIHEELEEAGDPPFSVGDEVVILEDHMVGMRGARSVIDSVEETTVYMVDFTTTDTGEAVTNHKWVTESELSAQ